MQKLKHPSKEESEYDSYIHSDRRLENLPSLNNKKINNRSRIIMVKSDTAIKAHSEKCAVNALEVSITKGTTDLLHPNNLEISTTTYQTSPQLSVTLDPFRLYVKNGEYAYARANDIIMIESCDHLVKVFLGIEGNVKLTLRHNTLKDFLSQLPQTQFKRLGRFCAVNIHRLSGGNCHEQTFEFDFKISIKLKHSVSHTVFAAIGK